MSGTGLLALLDDISTLLDDVATMTKVAAAKAAGVTGDDFAVTAEQVSGLSASREIPVVKAVAKGSLKNKMFLIPATMSISGLSILTGLPLIVPIMIVSGTYLCHEGMEKIFHKKDHKDDSAAEKKKMLEAAKNKTPEEFEKEKIKGAIRTDFVLSTEIMILTFGIVAAAPILTQVAVLAAVGVGMTAFVYGVVAGILKMDDVGLYMSKKEGGSTLNKMTRGIGGNIIKSAPTLLKGLSIAGTVAMFMVGGGILASNIPMLAAATHSLGGIASLGAEIVIGFAAGGASLLGITSSSKAYQACKRLLKLEPIIEIKDPGADKPPEAAVKPGTSLIKRNELAPIMTAAAAQQDKPAPQNPEQKPELKKPGVPPSVL